MESATDAAPSAQQPAGAECPWPSTVRGTLLKRCGVHGWRPRYATLKPSAKVFRYSRAKDDAVPRFQMTLDASVSLRSRPSFKAKWPGLSSAVQVFPFVIHSALGDMHFASRSEESRSKWIDALTWSVGLPEPIAGRPGASRRTLGAPSPAGSLTPVSRSSTRLGAGGAGAGAGSHPRGSAEPRALFARPSQSDEGEDAAAGVGEGDSGADGEDAPSGPDSEGQSDDEDASADGEDDDAASSGFGPVPAEGVPAWAVRAGAQHQREAIMRCSEEGKARCWTPSGAKSGMQCFTAKGGPPGARGDGVVPWPLAAILDILQNHREDVDEQLVSQTHLATISNHYIVSQMRYKSPSVFVGPREFVTLTHWKVWGGSEAADVGIPDGTLVISASSTSIPESITSAPVTAGHTRGEVPIGGWVVRPRPPATPGAVSTVCDAVYMSTLDPKGSLPHSVVQVAVAKQAMMVKALNDALAARYGGPTWDKAPKARASGPAQQLRNDGWTPPSAASRAKRARAAGAAASVPGLAVLAVVVHPHLAAHVFVLACAAFALRWLYRAVVGPAWMSTRQKLSIASWNPPGEGNIHGAVQLDATRALAWLAEARAATGKHVTVTHLVIKAVGLALRACPQLNGRVVLGEFIPAGSVDVGCLVAMEREEGGVRSGDLAYTKILAADRRPVGAIADDIAGAAKRLRALKDAEFESSKGAMRALPTWALRPVSHWLGWVSSALGLPIPFIGVRAFPVGSCMVTAVGGLGLDTAFAPFTPFLHVPLLVAIGSVKDAVLPVDGAPAVRKAVTVTATVDHRVVDGAGAAVLSRVLRAVFEQPAAMLGPPATVAVN
ncbi:hypothetical protein FNF31_02752 [Cafeteria roenbergensis]|uniref:PH domain-containing protein n=1 Tax=Cafeteria roenbergensis TaxID=33653 RepID=A0A5A8E4L1_CAFRO|nr:hypothetical protein FNF31_02752 [Cafeteria roenbergensis]KAA0171777.1 hypothetical protein FNF28_00413 [Cafeteria roenbergensis]